VDAAFVGVPFDTATSNRPGARFGPRHIRAESPMVRKRNHGTGAEPFRALKVDFTNLGFGRKFMGQILDVNYFIQKLHM
jgi:arginase family enzyme